MARIFLLLFAVRTQHQKVDCGGSRYGVICTFRAQPTSRVQGLFSRTKSSGILASCFLMLATAAGLDVGYSWAVCATVPNDGVSSGQQVETHGRYAASYAAAGEVTQGADLIIISSAGALWFRNILG